MGAEHQVRLRLAHALTTPCYTFHPTLYPEIPDSFLFIDTWPLQQQEPTSQNTAVLPADGPMPLHHQCCPEDTIESIWIDGQPQWIAATSLLYHVQPPDPDLSSTSDRRSPMRISFKTKAEARFRTGLRLPMRTLDTSVSNSNRTQVTISSRSEARVLA